jgi:hypothetical protein
MLQSLLFAASVPDNDTTGSGTPEVLDFGANQSSNLDGTK